MLFSNVDINPQKKEMEWGELWQIILGESGRGRRELRLTCCGNNPINKGLNPDFTIGLTRSGKPRINVQKDGTLYLIISTEGGYTRRGCGWIGSWKKNKLSYNVIAKGNGADGDAGRIGYWDVALIKVEGIYDNDWIRIRTSGGGYGTDPQWVNISSKGVFLFKDTQEAQEFADMTDVEFPNPEAENFKDLCK